MIEFKNRMTYHIDDAFSFFLSAWMTQACLRGEST